MINGYTYSSKPSPSLPCVTGPDMKRRCAQLSMISRTVRSQPESYPVIDTGHIGAFRNCVPGILISYDLRECACTLGLGLGSGLGLGIRLGLGLGLGLEIVSREY
jgi:hypothetical protein